MAICFISGKWVLFFIVFFHRYRYDAIVDLEHEYCWSKVNFGHLLEENKHLKTEHKRLQAEHDTLVEANGFVKAENVDLRTERKHLVETLENVQTEKKDLEAERLTLMKTIRILASMEAEDDTFLEKMKFCFNSIYGVASATTGYSYFAAAMNFFKGKNFTY